MRIIGKQAILYSLLGLFLPAIVAAFGLPAYALSAVTSEDECSPVEESSLVAHLNSFLFSQERGNKTVATKKLAAFLNEVMAFVNAGLINECQAKKLIDQSSPYGCWETSPVTVLEKAVCNYASASTEEGEYKVALYFSEEHSHTCYLSALNDEDVYDGGCNDGKATIEGGQFLMNYKCEGADGERWFTSGWLKGILYDGHCDRYHRISACEVWVRVPRDGC